MTIDAMSVAIAALFTALTGGVGAVWHALLTGKLVFGREVADRDKQLEQLSTKFDKTLEELDTTQNKERETLVATNTLLQQQLTELLARTGGPR